MRYIEYAYYNLFKMNSTDKVCNNDVLITLKARTLKCF